MTTLRALIWGFGLLLCCEMGIRTVDVERMVLTSGPVETEFRALSAYLDHDPLCELCFVGSSRVAEGVQIVQIDSFAPGNGESNSVRNNYGVSMARPGEVLAVVNRLLAKGTPRVIFYGLSAHPLAAGDGTPDFAPQLWTLVDAHVAWRSGDYEMGATAPDAAMTAFARWSALVRYRERLALLAWDVAAMGWKYDTEGMSWADVLGPDGRRGTTSHLRGEAPLRGGWWPAAQLSEAEVDHARLEDYVARTTGPGPATLRPAQLRRLEQLTALCAARGVRLVYFEVPLPRVFRRALGPALEVEFRTYMRDHARVHGVRFIELA
ncbi:MAG: hypothetical protein B7733_06810, partial [Myxococcales bacterium FL481]